MNAVDRWALVTGASSGLGADFARQLAARGYHLILVARREDRLRALASELTDASATTPAIRVQVEALDLSAGGAIASLVQRLDASGIAPEVLVNNAGFGVFGNFIDTPWERVAQMIDLDIRVLTELAHRLGGAMAARGRGYILNVSSIGAFQPTPTYGAYAAAKAYVLLLSEAMSYELRDRGVRVSALCPGITATEFLQVSGQKATLYQRLVMMDSASVVRIGLAGMWKGKPCIVPGVLNLLSAWSMRAVPRRLQAWMAYRLMRNA